MENRVEKKGSLRTGVWLAAALLLVLLLVTWALLAALMNGFAGGLNHVVSLTPEESGKTVYRTLYRPVEPDAEGVTEDQVIQWESVTDVDLFRESYSGSAGQTVVSADGDKVIAPGTTQSYDFAVRNTGNVKLKYTLTLNGAFDAETDNVPVLLRLRGGQNWLLGSTESWCSVDEINAYAGQFDLMPGSSDTFLLEWQWPFEVHADGEDTGLGNGAVDKDEVFTLTITTTAEAEDEAVAVSGDGKLLYEQVIGWKAILLFLLDLLLLGLLLLLLWRRKVYVTGFDPTGMGGTIECGRKKDTIRVGGRFVFPRVFTGKHSFKVGGAELKWKLKRKKDVQGIRFERDEDYLTVYIGRNIRAIEIYLVHDAAGLNINPALWAAIDSKRRVYTPTGVTEPAQDGTNKTPGGLTTDRKGKLSF